jgi:hypothetical protein
MSQDLYGLITRPIVYPPCGKNQKLSFSVIYVNL